MVREAESAGDPHDPGAQMKVDAESLQTAASLFDGDGIFATYRAC